MNLADLVRASADRHPNRAALVFHGREISYGELDDRIDLTASVLAGFGVRKGDRVALLAGNVPEYVSSFYGIARAGAVACPLNIQLTAEEIGYILADASARAAVVEPQALPTLLAVRDRLGDLETILVIGGPPAPRGTLSLEEVLRTAGEPPGIETRAGDLALIAYTSGTTAAPRGAMLSHANLLANLDQIAAVPILAPSAADVLLLVLPLFHTYGLSTLGLSLKAAATVVLEEGFQPIEALDVIKRYRVSVVAGAPPMYRAWIAAADQGAEPEFSSVRLAGSGASALPGDVLEAFRQRWGLTIWEGYGLTEAAPAVASTGVGGEARPGSVGLPLPGVQVRLVDEEGDEAEEDDPGEIMVRGPNVFAGYWGRPEATDEVLAGGWLRTGDVAVRDEDGYLYLVDRKKDLIVVSGFNVYPREVEDAIQQHPAVAEAAVVGIPDDRTGEAIKAWVAPRPGASVTEGQILDFLHGYLARFKWPREVHVVEELPRHVTGKLLRRFLRGEDFPAPAEEGTEA